MKYGTVLFFITGIIVSSCRNEPVIVVPEQSSSLISLAAKEIRRYTYTDSIEALGKDGFSIKTIRTGKNNILLITGNTDLGTLYGAYQYAEKTGVRFYAHGDVIPDGKKKFSIPYISEMTSPLFETRGLQPFHDFPEGPD